MTNLRNLFVLVLMLLAAFTRLIPHPANFTAVMAMAFFGGARFKNPFVAIIAPLSVMLVTDIFLGIHSLMPLVYTCIAITALIGIYIGEKANPLYILTGSVFSSILFFVVTNAGVWYHNRQFSQDTSGLMLCYDIAVPFFTNQVLGDLFFNTVLFGSWMLMVKKLPVLAIR